jgi:hypothetical protein
MHPINREIIRKKLRLIELSILKGLTIKIFLMKIVIKILKINIKFTTKGAINILLPYRLKSSFNKDRKFLNLEFS